MTTMRGSATCCLLVSGSSAQNPCPLILGQVHAVDQRPHNADSALLFFEMFLRRESGWISSSKIRRQVMKSKKHLWSVPILAVLSLAALGLAFGPAPAIRQEGASPAPFSHGQTDLAPLTKPQV